MTTFSRHEDTFTIHYTPNISYTINIQKLPDPIQSGTRLSLHNGYLELDLQGNFILNSETRHLFLTPETFELENLQSTL